MTLLLIKPTTTYPKHEIPLLNHVSIGSDQDEDVLFSVQNTGGGSLKPVFCRQNSGMPTRKKKKGPEDS